MSSSYNSDQGSQPSSAPALPSDSDLDDVIAPRWVQAVYGPPPPMVAIPVPAPIYVASTPEPAGAWNAATPAAYPAAYNINAYTPGAFPYGGGPHAGMMHRVRSPSTSTHPEASPESADDSDTSSPEGSPTKTPLFSGGDVENGSSGDGMKPSGLPLVDPTMPSRSIAMRERRKQQLRTCDKDSFGVPLPSTRRPFSIFASPFSVAEVCTGLGVYLSSVQAAVLLALLLSICSIYPLVDNVKSQRWADEYKLTNKYQVVATCSKGWELNSWITAGTIGGHCSEGPYTSSYDCAARCVWKPEKLQQPQCKNVQPPAIAPPGTAAANATSFQNRRMKLEGKCAQHLPCLNSQSDPTAPDGPCLCCNMELDPTATGANPRVSAGQLWMFFVGQLVFMAWMLFLVHTQLKAVHIQGTRVVGASDYSVWISGISKTRAEDGPLSHWCGQFGPVVAAFNVPSVGDALRVGRRVAALQARKAEADAFEGSTSCNPLQWLYRKVCVGRKRALEETLEQQQRKLAIYERQESEPTGQGLVTFEFSETAAGAIADFDRPPLRAALDWTTCGLTNATPKLHGSVVKLERAPEPSDILWEHTNCTGTPAVLRRVWSWTITTLIIFAGAGIQYGLAVVAERLRRDRMLAEYAAGTGDEWAMQQADNKTFRLRTISVLAGVVVVTINLTIMLTVRALSWYERWTTRTSMERWVMLKLSLSQLLNAFAAPMLAAYLSGNRSGWYSRGGLMEAAFFVQCINALVPPLFHLLGLGDKIKYFLLSRFSRTQPMLNQLLAPPPFPMAEQYAASVTTLGLALWFMPVLPISPLIALVGLSVSYCANKWVALRRAAAPPHLSGMVTSPLNWLLRLLPLVQLVLMKELYFNDYPTIDPMFYTGLAFWTLFCLAPIRALLGAVRRRRRTNASSGLSYHRLLGGKRLGVGEVYSPLVPKPCSRKFKEKVAATFAQLAPACFDSILNGDDVAKFLFGDKVGLMMDDMEEDVIEGGVGPQCSHPPQQQQQQQQQNGRPLPLPPPPRASLRASFAAGMHGTWALLWQPQDPDHPEDVFLPAAGGEATAADGDDSDGSGGDGANEPLSSHKQQQRVRSPQRGPRLVSASASASNGGSSGGSAGLPVTQVLGAGEASDSEGSGAQLSAAGSGSGGAQTPAVRRAGGGGSRGVSTPRTAAPALIPAVRHRSHQHMTAPATAPAPSRMQGSLRRQYAQQQQQQPSSGGNTAGGGGRAGLSSSSQFRPLGTALPPRYFNDR